MNELVYIYMTCFARFSHNYMLCRCCACALSICNIYICIGWAILSSKLPSAATSMKIFYILHASKLNNENSWAARNLFIAKYNTNTNTRIEHEYNNNNNNKMVMRIKNRRNPVTKRVSPPTITVQAILV